jgi:chromosome segregation ATPase
MNTMNKKRKTSPTEWSWASKLFNASSLAESVTEHSELVENLSARLHRVQVAYKAKVAEVALLKSNINEWSTSYESLKNDLQESQKLSASLFGEIETLKTDQAALAASLKANDEKITLQGEQLADQHDELVAKDVDYDSLKKELHRTKRECTEARARKKSWKKKYEELAQMGAAALAKQTQDSYGVSPDQFEAYKRIAATQFEVDKAQLQREEALKLLHANVNALEDKRSAI